MYPIFCTNLALKAGKEKFCLPFDQAWRMQQSGVNNQTALSWTHHVHHVLQGRHFRKSKKSYQYYFPFTSASKNRSCDQRISRSASIA